MSNRSSHFANRFQTMISAMRAAPLRVLFLAVAVAVVGLMTVADLPSASPVHAQEQAVTATRDATGESPPARPTDLQASAGPDSVSLTWTASTDQTVTHYAVLLRDRDEDDAGVFEVIDSNAGSATSYTDRSVSPGGSYVYRVKAVSPTGVSQWSSYARADIPADPEDLAPSGLSAKAVFDGGDSAGVELAWDAPAADAESVTGYEILRAVGDGDLATLVANTGSADTTYTDDTATEAGESYAYRVKALRGEEASQPSDRAVAFIPKVTTVDPEPGIAEEQNVHVEVWSATLIPGDIEGSLGCSNSNLTICSGGSILTDDDFDYDGTSYTVTAIILAIDGTLEIDVSATPTNATIADLVLNVSIQFPFRLSDATVTGSTLSWASTGLTWAATYGVPLSLNAGNRPPVFASSSALREVPENSPAGTDVGAPVTTSDPDGDTLTYTLEGADAASFGIGSSTGQIQTISGVTYDFENKNAYFVTVKADDGNGGTDTIFVAISLTDEDELAAVWSATFTPTTRGILVGCSGQTDEEDEYCSNRLTDHTFDYDGTSYTVSELLLRGETLEFTLSPVPTDATIADLTLNIGDSPFALSSATGSSILKWASSGLTWIPDSDSITVSLTEEAAGPGRQQRRRHLRTGRRRDLRHRRHDPGHGDLRPGGHGHGRAAHPTAGRRRRRRAPEVGGLLNRHRGRRRALYLRRASGRLRRQRVLHRRGRAGAQRRHDPVQRRDRRQPRLPRPGHPIGPQRGRRAPDARVRRDLGSTATPSSSSSARPCPRPPPRRAPSPSAWTRARRRWSAPPRPAATR